MGIFKLLSPTSWIGKFALWGMFFAAGYAVSEKTRKPCPPSTQINNDIKAKSKNGSTLSLGVETSTNTTDCIEWLRGQSMKDIRALRK